VAATHNSIAVIYGRQGKNEMALEQWEKGLAINIKALGEDHPEAGPS
jgi:Tfp pilus assembly protein PilF